LEADVDGSLDWSITALITYAPLYKRNVLLCSQPASATSGSRHCREVSLDALRFAFIQLFQ
jgi:hypothetical protein